MQLALLCRTCQAAAPKAKEGSTLQRLGRDAEGSCCTPVFKYTQMNFCQMLNQKELNL